MNNLSHLKTVAKAKMVKESSADIQPLDTLVVLHNNELEFIKDSLFYRLENDNSLTVDDKRTVLELLKHLEGEGDG